MIAQLEKFWEKEGRPSLLIIGLDPGTTVGIAALDLDGNPVALISERGIGRGEIINRLLGIGLPLVIGGDKANSPSLVDKVAARFGARRVSPQRDLRSSEKKELTTDLEIYPSNAHEQDALASAVFAYESVRKTLAKIRRSLKRRGEVDLAYGVAKLILTTQDMTAAQAVESLRNQETPPGLQNPESEKPFPPKTKPPSPLQKSIQSLKKDNKLLVEQNSKLKKKVELLMRTVTRMKEKAREGRDPKNKDAALTRLNRMGRSLERNIARIRKEKQRLNKELEGRDKALASGRIAIPFLRDLSRGEWTKVARIVGAHAAIFVFNPNTYSEGVIDKASQIADKLIYSIAPKSAKKKLSEAGFHLLDGAGLRLRREGPYALFSREELNELGAPEVSLNDIVSAHRGRSAK